MNDIEKEIQPMKGTFTFLQVIPLLTKQVTQQKNGLEKSLKS